MNSQGLHKAETLGRLSEDGDPHTTLSQGKGRGGGLLGLERGAGAGEGGVGGECGSLGCADKLSRVKEAVPWEWLSPSYTY